ncbi:MAG: hypothetical protein U0798_19120 [Gemmataceae bacterium]
MTLAILALALAAPPDTALKINDLQVSPSTITLNGPRDVRQLVATGRIGDNRVVDVTDTVVSANPPGIVDVGDRCSSAVSRTARLR